MTFPAGLTSIGNRTFNGCTGLKDIYFKGNTPPTTSTNATNHTFNGVTLADITVHVPVETASAFNVAPWSQMKSIVESPSSTQPQTIENFTDFSVNVGSVITLEAVATSGLEVTYTIEEGKEDIATLEGNILTIVGEGTVYIIASQAGGGDWEPAEDVTITVITSTKSLQTIEGFNDYTAFVGEQVTLKATASSGLEVTYTFEEGKDAVAKLEDNVLTIMGEGTATVTALQAGNDEFTATQKTITLTTIDYTWLKAPAIAVHGNTTKVVGPVNDVTNFTRFYIGDNEVEGFDNANGADLSDTATGTIILKATNTSGSQAIRLTISK